MIKAIVCIAVIGAISVLAKTDTLTVINCKCDTLKIIKTVDTTVSVKLDTLKTKVEKKVKVVK